jgi:hypothetical protein
MENAKSAEMPFGTAILFTVIGAVFLSVYLLYGVGPALWIRFGYRPIVATAVETRPAEWSGGKGPRVHGLEARLAFTVDGRDYQAWVRLPLNTRETKGPEAEKIRTQVKIRQQLSCFYNPRDPGSGVVLERTKLEWSMLGVVVFALAFLLVGISGLVTSWNRTFPRGAATEVFDVVRRLPRAFYLYFFGAVLVIAAGVTYVGESTSGLSGLVLLGLIAVVAVLVRQAAQVGKVAWPSQERRLARGRGAGHPSVDDKPTRPAIEPWAPPPVTVGQAEWLAARLSPTPLSVFPVRPAGVTFLVVFIGALIGYALVSVVWKNAAGQPRSADRWATMALIFLPAASSIVVWRRAAAKVRGLRVEVSGHPLEAGSEYEILVAHSDKSVLEALRLELRRKEEAASGDQRGGKNTSRASFGQGTVALEDFRSTGGDLSRRGQLRIPERAYPSLALKHHWVEWFLVVRFRGLIPQEVSFPVTLVVKAPVSEPPVPRTHATSAEDDGPGSIWLNGGAAFSPSGLLDGGYSVEPLDERRLESVELSVLWETGSPGAKDLGVCHYEDRAAVDGDDLALYGARSFAITLPDGPPSFQGSSVKVRWLVRLRLRYTDGGELLREQPFLVGRTEV